MAMEVAIGIGVDRDRRRLARPHVVELGLLEIRGHPDVVRHEHGERGPRRHIFADRGGEIDDAAGLVGDDRRIGKVQLRLVALGLGLLDVGLRARALRLERLHLALRQLERRLRVLDRGLLGFEILDVDRALLSRRPTLVDERLVASPGDLRKLQVRLRLVHLRLAGGDLRLLHVHLRVDVAHRRLCGGDLRLGLFERDAIRAIVDADDHLAGGDMLVVGDRNRGDIARDLRRNGKLPRGDEGVVGRFEMGGVVHVEVSRAPDHGQEQQAGDRGDRAPAEKALANSLGGAVHPPPPALGRRPAIPTVGCSGRSAAQPARPPAAGTDTASHMTGRGCPPREPSARRASNSI